VLAKVIAHWIVAELPLVLVAPVLGLQFGLSQNSLAIIVVSLLLGTPVLSVIGSIGAALTLGLRAANVLVALLVLPLYIPVLIFGSGAVRPALREQSAGLVAFDGSDVNCFAGLRALGNGSCAEDICGIVARVRTLPACKSEQA
jgi:heme exporter protein CcmB